MKDKLKEAGIIKEYGKVYVPVSRKLKVHCKEVTQGVNANIGSKYMYFVKFNGKIYKINGLLTNENIVYPVIGKNTMLDFGGLIYPLYYVFKDSQVILYREF